MIRPIDIRLNAAHPELPLAEAVTFTGAPSTVLIRGVPPNCGRWAITAVSVAATFPDGSTTTRAAVQSANGVWVATLPATATSGRTANGLRVMADGIDENGAAVTGYILGVADFAVASLGVAPAPEPGETSWQMLYFDEVPNTLRKGDVTKVDGVLKFYNGTAWEPFAAPATLDDAVTRTSANGVKSSGIWSALWGALAALPTGFTSLYDWCVSQLAGKATKADAMLTERGFSAWNVVCSNPTVHGFIVYDGDNQKYQLYDSDSPEWLYDETEAIWPEDSATSLQFRYLDADLTFVATRTALQGYQLGSQSDKPLASEAEAEALRTAVVGKQSALSAQQLANIAAVSDALAFDAAHSYAAGDPVVYDGTLYTFTATHTGAWTGSDVSAVDIIARLALKANNADVVHKSGDETIAGVKTFSGGIVMASAFGLDYNALIFGGINEVYAAIGNASDEVLFWYNGNAVMLKVGNGGTIAFKDEIPYTIGTPTVISTASWETVEGETVYYGAATLADRTANIVQVTAATALDELRITLPAATSGKVRDFGLRVEIGTGSAALTAPALVPIAPTGETITLENADGTIPALADGTATAKGVTLLYFSETAPGVFVVKGEQVEEVA